MTLASSPALAIAKIKDGNKTRPTAEGQGDGVEGEGWTGVPLVSGEGGEEVLNRWLGWRKGRDFIIEKGGLVWGGKAKL